MVGRFVVVRNVPMNNKPCVKCGSTDRGKPKKGRVTGDCRSCMKVRSAKYRRDNPESKLYFRTGDLNEVQAV